MWAAVAPGGAQAAAPKAPIQAAPVAGDPILGKALAESEGCFECHDPDRPAPPTGQGPDTVWPRLTGQPAAYLAKQLQDFRSGARKHDFMAIMARSLGEPEVHHITAYFASLPSHAAPPDADPQTQDHGRRLFKVGDAGRGIPACIGCHDSVAAPADITSGTPATTPRLAGQDPRYLASQLRAWRSGERRNSPGGVMTDATKALSDDDIRALSEHLGAP